MPAVRPTFRPHCEQLEAREVPSFGTGGVVTADLPADVGNGPVTALQPDGKIVSAVGNKVARFNADGSVDLTFNGTGVRTLTGSATNPGAIYDVEVMADGRIVVGGIVGVGDGQDFYLERLLPDGTPDPTFSGDGVVITGFKKGSGARDSILGIALQGDGKIVAVGEINGIGQWGVARFNANGTLDTTFSGDGWLTDAFDKQTRDEFPTAVELQADGKIVVAGSAVRSATSRDWVAARYTTAGTLDSSFGTGGKAWVDFGPEAGVAWTPETRYVDLALAPDGRVVLAGESSGDRLGVARLTTAGALDPTFSGNGRLLTVPPGWTVIAPNDDYNVAVQSDGRVVVTVNGQGGDTAVGRLNADGTADTSFDGDGWNTFRFDPNGTSDITGVILQPDGKIVVAGSVWIDDQSVLALARLNPDGSFDA
jgi:uncharacterized delta-60 repeat protein